MVLCVRGCRSPASLGWAVYAGSGGSLAGYFLFKLTCSGTVSVVLNSYFFSEKKKIHWEISHSSVPHHMNCKGTGSDGLHLPLLFDCHVNLPWCGAGFSTNSDALSLQFFHILIFFSSNCCRASRERMTAILISSSHLLSLFTPFPFLFPPLFLGEDGERRRSPQLSLPRW